MLSFIPILKTIKLKLFYGMFMSLYSLIHNHSCYNQIGWNNDSLISFSQVFFFLFIYPLHSRTTFFNTRHHIHIPGRFRWTITEQIVLSSLDVILGVACKNICLSFHRRINELNVCEIICKI